MIRIFQQCFSNKIIIKYPTAAAQTPLFLRSFFAPFCLPWQRRYWKYL